MYAFICVAPVYLGEDTQWNIAVARIWREAKRGKINKAESIGANPKFIG